MAHRFKIWDQGNDGRTMGIRVDGVTELERFAGSCTMPDLSDNYQSLQEYLDIAELASTPPPAYSRYVDVVWLSHIGYGRSMYIPHRTLVVTYTGNRRQTGGYASQAYCIVDPNGYPELASHHQRPILVEYVAHATRDALVVMAEPQDGSTDTDSR